MEQKELVISEILILTMSERKYKDVLITPKLNILQVSKNKFLNQLSKSKNCPEKNQEGFVKMILLNPYLNYSNEKLNILPIKNGEYAYYKDP